MSLSEKVKSGQKPELTEAEAAFCIFMAVIYADGKMSDEELSEFSYYFNKIKLFKNHTVTELFNEFQKLFEHFGYNPVKVVELACPFISTSNRLPVFIYCCDFVYSENVVKSNEEMLLQDVMFGLTLDEKIAENAIQIMKRKSQL
jgi:hypothetical protein